MNAKATRLMTALMSICAWATTFGSPSSAQAAEIDLTVDNIKGTQGSLMVALYANAADFRTRGFRQIMMPATGPSMKIRIPDLPPGDYAIALYHDRNDNAKLDANLLGMPKEPYGFSGNATNLMAPATWDQARFVVVESGAPVLVRLSD